MEMANEVIGGEISMIKMLDEQGEKIERHGESIDKLDQAVNNEIFPRLESLEREQLQFKQEMLNVQKGQKELELTVMKDGQQTRELLGRFVDHYFGTDDKKLMMNEKVTMKRLSRTEKIVLGFFAILGGSGGVIAGLITLFDKFGGQ